MTSRPWATRPQAWDEHNSSVLGVANIASTGEATRSGGSKGNSTAALISPRTVAHRPDQAAPPAPPSHNGCKQLRTGKAGPRPLENHCPVPIASTAASRRAGGKVLATRAVSRAGKANLCTRAWGASRTIENSWAASRRPAGSRATPYPTFVEEPQSFLGQRRSWKAPRGRHFRRISDPPPPSAQLAPPQSSKDGVRQHDG